MPVGVYFRLDDSELISEGSSGFCVLKVPVNRMLANWPLPRSVSFRLKLTSPLVMNLSGKPTGASLVTEIAVVVMSVWSVFTFRPGSLVRLTKLVVGEVSVLTCRVLGVQL